MHGTLNLEIRRVSSRHSIASCKFFDTDHLGSIQSVIKQWIPVLTGPDAHDFNPYFRILLSYDYAFRKSAQDIGSLDREFGGHSLIVQRRSEVCRVIMDWTYN